MCYLCVYSCQLLCKSYTCLQLVLVDGNNWCRAHDSVMMKLDSYNNNVSLKKK